MLNDVVTAQNCLVVFVQPGDAPRREGRHILDDANAFACKAKHTHVNGGMYVAI